MHYYQFNIGDYATHTRFLSLMEDLAYRRLIDLSYTTEKPLISDVNKLSRLIGMPEHKAEIEQVLEDFFTKTSDGNEQKRIIEEIAKYHSKADSARVNGQLGGRPKKPKKTQSVIFANPEETGSKANQEPITNNHKPITKKKTKDLSTHVDLVENVFDYWLDVMGKNKKTSKLTAKRKKAIADRLKDGYELETVLLSIDGCRADDWSMGQNDRGKPFNDIELICRTGEKLEHFAELGAGLDTDTSFLDGPSVFDMPEKSRDLNVIKGVFKNA